MASVIITIAIIIISLILIIWLIKQHSTFKYVLWHFKKCNCVVSGKKGSGKDLLFQKVINKRKDFYYANIGYGGNHKKISLKDISLKSKDGKYHLTYNDFLNDKVEKTNHKFREKSDFYISDGGIFLPSHMDSSLHKTYPSLPIFYALSRHLYDSNIHVNVQNIDRLWKPLREQADFFIDVKRTIKLPFILLTRYTCYEKMQSAIQRLTPMKARALNKFSKAEYDKYTATNGVIKNGWIIQLKRNVKYDTRAFEKIVLKGKRLLKK